MALFLFNMVAVFFRIYRLWFVFMVDGDEPVEVSFAYSNGSSIDTKVLVKQASDWKADQGYRLNKDLQMSSTLRSCYEWSEWLKNFVSFLGTIAFARKFWDLGEFLLPFDLSTYTPVNVSTNLSNMFAGVSTSSATPARTTSSSANTSSASSTSGSTNVTSVTTVMIAKHPLTQMLKMDQAAYDMQFINDFYVRVIEYILRIFKWSVSTNDAAYAIFIAFQEVPQNLFTIVNAISNRFSDVAQDVQLRISSFGTCTMHQLGCKTVDALVSFLARERRFLASAGRVVTDNEMVHALQVGLSGSFPKVAEFLVNLQNSVQALGGNLDFGQAVARMFQNNKQLECLETYATGKKFDFRKLIGTPTHSD